MVRLLLVASVWADPRLVARLYGTSIKLSRVVHSWVCFMRASPYHILLLGIGETLAELFHYRVYG